MTAGSVTLQMLIVRVVSSLWDGKVAQDRRPELCLEYAILQSCLAASEQSRVGHACPLSDGLAEVVACQLLPASVLDLRATGVSPDFAEYGPCKPLLEFVWAAREHDRSAQTSGSCTDAKPAMTTSAWLWGIAVAVKLSILASPGSNNRNFDDGDQYWAAHHLFKIADESAQWLRPAGAAEEAVLPSFLKLLTQVTLSGLRQAIRYPHWQRIDTVSNVAAMMCTLLGPPSNFNPALAAQLYQSGFFVAILKCVQTKLGRHENAFALLHAIFFAADADHQSKMYDMLVRSNALRFCCDALRPKLFVGDVEDSVDTLCIGACAERIDPSATCSTVSAQLEQVHMAAELALDLLGTNQPQPGLDSDTQRLGCTRGSLTALDAQQVDVGLQNGRSAPPDIASTNKPRDGPFSDKTEVYVGMIAVTAMKWVLTTTQLEDFGEPSDLVQEFEQSKADCIQVVLTLLHSIFTRQLPNLDVDVQPLYPIGGSIMCESMASTLLGDHTMEQLTELWFDRFAIDQDVPLFLLTCGDDRSEASVVQMLAQLGHDQAPHLDLIRLNAAFGVLANVEIACLAFRSYIRKFQNALMCFVQTTLQQAAYVEQLPIHFTASALLARMHDEELQTALAMSFGNSVATQESMRLPSEKLFTSRACTLKLYAVICKQKEDVWDVTTCVAAARFLAALACMADPMPAILNKPSDLPDVVHGLHLILAQICEMTIVTQLMDSIVGSVTHLLHLVLIHSSYDEFEQILVDHDELPVILIGLLGQVPFAAGRMSAELQEQQRIGIMYTPQICDVPVALLQCILAAVLVRGRCQQDLDYFSTLFVPVVARLFKSAVHQTLLYVNCLADKEDVPRRDAPIVPKDLTVLLDVIVAYHGRTWGTHNYHGQPPPKEVADDVLALLYGLVAMLRYVVDACKTAQTSALSRFKEKKAAAEAYNELEERPRALSEWRTLQPDVKSGLEQCFCTPKVSADAVSLAAEQLLAEERAVEAKATAKQAKRLRQKQKKQAQQVHACYDSTEAAAAAMHTIQLDGQSKQLLEVDSLQQTLHQRDRQQPPGQQLGRQSSGQEPTGQVDGQKADEVELKGQLQRQSPVETQLQASTLTNSANGAARLGADAGEAPPAAHGVQEHALLNLFCCPMTKVVMRDPVIAADGHTYERQAMEAWLLHHCTSPVTGHQLSHTRLIPNVIVRSVVMSRSDLV